jgi:uncharacterized protein
MDITPAIPAGRQTVESYGAGRFRVGGALHPGSVLVFPERTLSWPVTAFDSLTLESLAPVLEAPEALELLVLGCGARMEMVPPELRDAVRAHGLVIEAMDTGAACRTYNVLLMEERRVAAALIAVE